MPAPPGVPELPAGRAAPSPRVPVAIRSDTASKIATVSATVTNTVDLTCAALFPLVFMANDFIVDLAAMPVIARCREKPRRA